MAISHSGTIISFDGIETGDNVRAYIAANGLGTVVGRTANVDASIRPASATSEFTDNNCTWVFNGSYHWDFLFACERFEIVDGVIVYAGSEKSHTSQPRANNLKLENVQYRAEVGGGRTDFFSNNASGFEFSNVQFLSYGGGNYLHLATQGGLLENVSVKVGSGSLTFQPDCNSGQELIMRDWTLEGVTNIIGNGEGRDLTAVTRLENLTWDNTTWAIAGGNRGQYYKVINPNKPTGWTGYVGSSSLSNARCDEFHTYNAKLVDENNTPLVGFKLKLTRNDDTPVFDLTTDASGDIPEQEILTYEQTGTGGSFTQYPDFKLSGIAYNNTIASGVRSLQDGRIDEVVTSVVDRLITETDKTIAASYVSQETPAKAYDQLKSVLTDNFNGETETTVIRDGNTLDARAYNVVIDGTGAGTATFDGTTITLYMNGLSFDGDILTTGGVSFINGGRSLGNVTSATLDSAIAISNSDSWVLYSTAADRDVNTNAVFFSSDGTDLHRFLFTGVETFYYRVTVAGVTFLIDVIASASGLTTQILSNDALINSIAQTVGELQIEHGVINEGIKKASLIIPHTDDLPT